MTLKVFLTDKYKEVNDTRIFDTLKARITVPQAAAHYGIWIGRNGMCRCPFHSDKTPSMKINETYYYCFGCHSTGDVIDFTARLFDLSPLDAARKLAADFGIDPNTPASAAVAPPRIRQEESQRDREDRCASVLIEYERLLKSRQQQFAPVQPSEEWDDRLAANRAGEGFHKPHEEEFPCPEKSRRPRPSVPARRRC